MKILDINVIRGSNSRKVMTAVSKLARKVIQQVRRGYANVSVCITNRYGVKTACIMAYEYNRQKRIIRARAYVDDGKNKTELLLTIGF